MPNKLISPNELHQAAKDQMLDGREPVTDKDWQLCANFWAANIAAGLEVAATPLVGMIFDCPLGKETLIKIAEFQASKKRPN